MLKDAISAVITGFLSKPGISWIWPQILCCCAFPAYCQDLQELEKMAWHAPERPLPGNRTVWDGLPEISPWRCRRWSKVYSGEAKRVEDIQAVIDQAAKSAARQIVIPPGVYRANQGAMPSFRLSALEFNGLEDTEIVAAGVTIISHSSQPVLQLRNLKRVKLRGLSLDTTIAALPFTQGTVLEVDTGKWADIELHKGYPELPEGLRKVRKAAVYQSGSLLLKPGVYTMYEQPVEKRGSGLYRLHKPKGNIAAGDLMTFIPGSGGHAVSVHNCEDLQIDDVSIHSSHMFCIIDINGLNNKYRRLRITPGPMPDDAEVPRLKSSAQDGIHFKSMRGGCAVEDCLIECHSDDAIAANTPYQLILKVAGAKIIYSAKNDVLRTDDHACITRPDDMRTVATGKLNGIAAITDDDETPELRRLEKELMPKVFPRHLVGRTYRVATFEKPVDCRPGDLLSSLSCNRGLIVRGNFVRNARARGFMLKCADLVVEANVMSHTQDSAFNGSPEVYWLEAGAPENVVIKGNLFRGVGFSPQRQHGGVVTFMARNGKNAAPPGVFRNIRIIDNVFEHSYKQAIHVTSCAGITVAGNQFLASIDRQEQPVLTENCLDAEGRAIQPNSAADTVPDRQKSIR